MIESARPEGHQLSSPARWAPPADRRSRGSRFWVACDFPCALTIELSGARRRLSLVLYLPRVRSSEVLGASSLAESLACPNVLKVGHALDQDPAVLWSSRRFEYS